MADLKAAIRQAAERYGVDADTLTALAAIESNFDPGAKNPKSSAGGLFQFVDATASQYGLENKFDPFEAADAAARLARDNTAALERALGRPPTPGELYLAHQQGAGGALKLLQNPDRPAAELVGPDAIRNNAGRPDMTGRDFAALWDNKIKAAMPSRKPGGFMSMVQPLMADIGNRFNSVTKAPGFKTKVALNMLFAPPKGETGPSPSSGGGFMGRGVDQAMKNMFVGNYAPTSNQAFAEMTGRTLSEINTYRENKRTGKA